MPSKKRRPNKKTSRWIGQPVCVVLNDGRCYVGTVEGVEQGELVLSGVKTARNVKPSSSSMADHQAQVSGFLGSLFGGGAFNPFAAGAAGSAGAAAAPASGFGLGGLGGLMGMWGKVWPGVRFGVGMVRMIMPLMGVFKK
jgi:small nuclear ribonucleoprotein (snRNP)-like protein